MEKEFFLTVANYSLPENTEKYIEDLRNVPDTSNHYDYVKWLDYGFGRRLGRGKIKGFIYPSYEPKVFSLFVNKDFKSFEHNRKIFISILNQILNGKDFFEMKDFGKINGYASSLLSRETFGVFTSPGKCVLRKTLYHPHMDDKADELEEVFAFACYGLVSFLANSAHGGRDRIRKCPICKTFFIAKDKKRKLCYDNPSCYTEYKRLQKRKQRRDDPVKYI